MLMKIFALYDLKSGAHGTPFFMHHVGEAVRACIDLGSDLNTTVGRHPADFALHELGTFDTDTGLLAPMQPVSHGAVVTFLPERRQPALFDQRGFDKLLLADGAHPSQDPEAAERARPNGPYRSAAEA